MSKAEKKKRKREATARWLAKPGNMEKHRAAVKRCREGSAAKEAHRIRARIYAAKNRETERLKVAKWRAENPEKAAESHRVYYLKNGDAVRAAAKKRRLENPEACLEYSRLYKAAKRAGGGRLSNGCIQRLLREQGGNCGACRQNLKDDYHVDHKIPISKGGRHCDENVQILCPTCNRRKSDKNLDDFLTLLAREAA